MHKALECINKIYQETHFDKFVILKLFVRFSREDS